MDGSFFGPDPAQLAVAGHSSPEGAHIGPDFLQGLPDDKRFPGFDGGGTELVAASDREGEPVSFQAGRVVRQQLDIGRGVVGVRVHCIGAGEALRGRDSNVPDGQANDSRHGLFCGNYTIPGGEPGLNLGITGVHEVGHYLGLYHTFENGCSSPGDEVEDTPYQSEPNYSCPTSNYSCGSYDDIGNYMDYMDDDCLTHFTQGQKDRIDWAIETYRPILLENTTLDYSGPVWHVSMTGSDETGDGSEESPFAFAISSIDSFLSKLCIIYTLFDDFFTMVFTNKSAGLSMLFSFTYSSIREMNDSPNFFAFPRPTP